MIKTFDLLRRPGQTSTSIRNVRQSSLGRLARVQLAVRHPACIGARQWVPNCASPAGLASGEDAHLQEEPRLVCRPISQRQTLVLSRISAVVISRATWAQAMLLSNMAKFASRGDLNAAARRKLRRTA